MSKKIEILFSDITLGTTEFGFIPRLNDPDEEDLAYQRHLHRNFPNLQARVANGYVFLNHQV